MMHIIAASVALLTAVAPPQEQEIPPLTKEIVLELLRFELPDINPETMTVLDVRQLEELGRAEVRDGSAEAIVKLQCQRTDFGPKWRFAEPLPPELKTAGLPAPTPEKTPPPQQEEPQSETPAESQQPAEAAPSISYKVFLTRLFDAVRAEREEDYAGFYFREGDFNLEAVAAEGDPLQQLEDRRTAFMRQCVQLSLQLRGAERFDTISFFATRSSNSERAELRGLMPQARRYIKAVSVEVMVDGRLGTIIFEGLTLMPDGWRLGGIVKVDIAQQSIAEPPPAQ